jgi:hypothetical protein
MKEASFMLNTFTSITSLLLFSTAPMSLTSVVVGQEVTVTVVNPSTIVRENEPVVIAWSELQKKLGRVQLSKLRFLNEQSRSLPFQIDDLDGDGTPDEFVFTADFAPKQERRFILTATADTLASPNGPLRTDVANYKRIGGVATPVDDDDGPGLLRAQSQYVFDGVGWESEVIGYRLYLDERNAIDIQAKRLPGLHWNFIGSSGVNYQLDAYWGMDVLQVGPALGLGGWGFWVNDTIAYSYKLDRRRARVIARGPVRAVVRVDYYGWDLGKEKVDVTSQFIIYAADRLTEHRLYLNSGVSPKTIATGIVKHAPAKVFWNPTEATLYTVGVQSRANDSLFMALTFSPTSVVTKTEDKPNHLVLLKLEKDKPVKYLISAYWQGETGRMWSEAEVKKFLQTAASRLNEPVRVKW